MVSGRDTVRKPESPPARPKRALALQHARSARESTPDDTAVPSAIGELFPDLSPEEFLRDYYPGRVAEHHGPLARLTSLIQESRLFQPVELIRSGYRETVIAYVRTAAGRRHQVDVTPASAIELYRCGSTVDISGINLALPAVGRFTDSLRNELGLNPLEELGYHTGVVKCDAIVSEKGDAVPKHFDSVETMSIHLAGTKIWRIAPAAEVAFPLHPHFPSLHYNRRDGQAYPKYFPEAFSHEMPPGTREIVMKPGSVLFLPRGTWHETEALEPTISIAFVLKTPSRGDVIASIIDRIVEADAYWRQPLPLATADHYRQAYRDLESAIERIGHDLGAFPSPSVLPALELYRMATGSKFHLRRATRNNSGAWNLDIAAGTLEPANVELDADLAQIVRWVMAVGRPFATWELGTQLGIPTSSSYLRDCFLELGLIELCVEDSVGVRPSPPGAQLADRSEA